MSPDMLFALSRAMSDRRKEEASYWANLYAILCNLLGGGKKTWTAEDWLGGSAPNLNDSEKGKAALAAYRRAVSESRKNRESSAVKQK